MTGFDHDALIYDSDEEFVGLIAPILEQGLENGETVLAVLNRRSWGYLREALGPAADQVAFTDRDSWYVRPATTIAAFDETVRRHTGNGSPSVRAVAEIQFGPDPAEWDQWIAYEAILNHSLAPLPAQIICAYDTRVLPDEVIESAWRTHPEVTNGKHRASPDYDGGESVVRDFGAEPTALPALHTLAAADDLSAFRQGLAVELTVAKFSTPKVLDMVLAASEVAANAWKFADGPETVRVGIVGGRFVCEIRDGGSGFDDPFAGYIPPDPGISGPAGLWVARQLVWRLEHFSDADGHTVRLWL
jgi:anti-sigma regulatory factor (Ser/Thr protein kinase)